MTALSFYFIGYFLSFVMIFVANRKFFYQKIEIIPALLYSILSWLFIVSLILALLIVSMSDTLVFKQINDYFSGKDS